MFSIFWLENCLEKSLEFESDALFSLPLTRNGYKSTPTSHHTPP